MPTAHWVGFSRVGPEIVMQVGFVEMEELVAEIGRAAEEERTPDLHVKVFARFGLGPATFVQLKDNVDTIYEAMVESGHLESSGNEKS